MNDPLLDIEAEIPGCPNHGSCCAASATGVILSRVQAGDPGRGHRQPKVIILTAQPDTVSAGGSAYAGQTGTETLSFLCNPEWLIRLDSPEELARLGTVSFMQKHRIYRTSVVKCATQGDVEATYGVVRNCRQRFLNRQIANMTEAQLIITMGRLAIASILQVAPDNFRFARLIGSIRGIIPRHRDYNKAVVALPHPSGANRVLFRPPRIGADGKPGSRADQRMLDAVTAIRRNLEVMGYRPLG